MTRSDPRRNVQTSGAHTPPPRSRLSEGSTSAPQPLSSKGFAAMPVDDRDLDGAYTTAEAAEKLKVSVPTVKRMIRDGELETYRVRGRVFIPHRAVLVYVNSTRSPGAGGKR